MTRKIAFLAALALVVSADALARSPLPWLPSVGAAGSRQEILTIRTQASVTVSDGKTYRVDTVFHDPQRAVFQRTYPDRTVIQCVDGRYIWSFDGSRQTEASAFVGGVVLGHQFHAQILFYDRLHGEPGQPQPARFAGEDCLAVSGADGDGWRLFFVEEGRPLGVSIAREDMPEIQVVFRDWRRVEGIDFPFLLDIDDGERQFRYEYTSIELNDGELADFRAPVELLTDEQRLLRLHRTSMDDHFFGRTTGMMAARADSLTIVSQGEVHRVSAAELEKMMRGVMSSRDYVVYDDLIRPIVEVSSDGTQGRVFVQIHAQGTRFDATGAPGDALEFTCAWISLFKKVDGDWKLTGNVSNFQPQSR